MALAGAEAAPTGAGSQSMLSASAHLVANLLAAGAAAHAQLEAVKDVACKLRPREGQKLSASATKPRNISGQGPSRKEGAGGNSCTGLG